MLLLEYHPRGLLVTGGSFPRDMGSQLEPVGATNCFPQHMINWAVISLFEIEDVDFSERFGSVCCLMNPWNTRSTGIDAGEGAGTDCSIRETRV